MIEIILVFIAILLGACLPSIIWLLFFLREEIHPIPSRFLIYTFGAGAFISFFILITQFFFNETIVEKINNPLISLFGFAFIEEFFKFGAVFFAAYKTLTVKNYAHAMILSVTASLGFANIENIFALAGTINFINFQSLYAVVYVIIARFFGATFLHALAAGILGYFWARGIEKGKKFLYVSFGIISAVFIHATFNYLVIVYQTKNLLIYPTLFLITVLFFVITDFEILKKEEIQSDKLI